MTTDTNQNQSGDTGTSNPFPMNPTAFLGMMQDILRKTTAALSNGDTDLLKGLPMDPTAFIKELEHIIGNFGNIFGSKVDFPVDREAFLEWWKDMMAKVPGQQNMDCFKDPTAFFRMFEEMAQRTAGAAREAAPNPTDLFNPLWWMKKGGETMQRTADMFTPGGENK